MLFAESKWIIPWPCSGCSIVSPKKATIITESYGWNKHCFLYVYGTDELRLGWVKLPALIHTARLCFIVWPFSSKIGGFRACILLIHVISQFECVYSLSLSLLLNGFMSEKLIERAKKHSQMKMTFSRVELKSKKWDNNQVGANP